MQLTQRTAALAAALACGLLAGTVAVADFAVADDGTEDATVSKSISYYGSYEGYASVDEWSDAVEGKKERRLDYLDGIIDQMSERDDIDWNDERLVAIKIRQDIDHAYSVATADALKEDLSGLEGSVEEAIEERDAEIEAEEEAARIAEEEAAAEEYYYDYYDYDYYDYGYSGGGYHPSGGLTPESGVNYYGDQRETYYSSNVLRHYQTDSWSVDDEGFYREGDYYVVAANDGQYSEGDTYTCSKGTAIVRDSGCDYGTTDYYVAW